MSSSRLGEGCRKMFEYNNTQDRTFRCDQCSKYFKCKGNLQQHKRTHTGERPFKCNYCNKCFSHKGHLNEHRRIHTGEKPFQCNQCDKCFTRGAVLRQHARTHTGEKPFQCNVCGKRFNQKGLLNQHAKTYSGSCLLKEVNFGGTSPGEKKVKNFVCNNCGKSFRNKANLNQHKRTHTGEKEFKCDHCHKRFSHKGHLNEHKRIHTGEKPFKCNHCDKCFNRKGLLKQHQLTYHLLHYLGKMPVTLPTTFAVECLSRNHPEGVDQQTVSLQQSKRIDKQQQALCGNHGTDLETQVETITSTNKEVVLAEELCQESIGVLPSSLQRLETPEYATINEMHKGQEENTEDKQWLPSMEDVLGETEIPHTRVKRFECKQCGTRFSLRGQLKQHKTTHAGEKRFECNFCLKRFSHKGHFNEHKRIHTGEKPFKCNECEKCFNRKGLLKQHQKLTHQQFKGDTTVQAGNIQSNKYVDKWQESLMCTFGDKSKDQVVIAKKETKTTNKTTNDQSKYTQLSSSDPFSFATTSPTRKQPLCK